MGTRQSKMTCLSAGAACQLEDTTAKQRNEHTGYILFWFFIFSVEGLLVLLSVAVQSNITLLNLNMCLSSSVDSFFAPVLGTPLSLI